MDCSPGLESMCKHRMMLYTRTHLSGMKVDSMCDHYGILNYFEVSDGDVDIRLIRDCRANDGLWWRYSCVCLYVLYTVSASSCVCE